MMSEGKQKWQLFSVSTYAASRRVRYTPKFVISVFVIGGSDCITIVMKSTEVQCKPSAQFD